MVARGAFRKQQHLGSALNQLWGGVGSPALTELSVGLPCALSAESHSSGGVFFVQLLFSLDQDANLALVVLRF